MIFRYEGIWEPCSKDEYENGVKKCPLFAPFRRIPIYHGFRGGILEYIKLSEKEPDDWKYEKKVGGKWVCLITSAEAEDKELMDYLKSL